MDIIIRYLILLLSVFWGIESFATVPVMRYPSGTPTQVCQPSDSNSNCGGGSSSGVNWNDIGGVQSTVNVSGFNNDAGYITNSGINWAGLTILNGTGVNWSSFYPTSNPFAFISSVITDLSLIGSGTTLSHLGINFSDITTLNTTGINWSSFYPTSNPFSYLTSATIPWGNGNTTNMTGVNWQSFYPTSNPLNWLTSWANGTTSNMTGINWQNFAPTSSVASNWPNIDLLNLAQTFTANKNGGGNNWTNINLLQANQGTFGATTTNLDTLTTNTNTTASGITINGVSAGGIGGIDANTELMLHLNNNVNDLSQNNLSVTNTSVTYSNSSPNFSGTYYGVWNGSSSYLSVPNETYFNFGSSNFTIDFWAQFSSLPTSGKYVLLWDKGDATWANGMAVLVQNTSGTYTLVVDIYIGGALDLQLSKTITPGTSWNHYAIEDYSNTIYEFFNGTQLGTDSLGSYSVPTTTTPILIGKQDSTFGGNSLWFNGNIQEYRVSNSARWTTSFTPAASEYTSTAVLPSLTFDSSGSTLAQIKANGFSTLLQFVNNGILGFQLDSSGNPYFPVLTTNGLVQTTGGAGEMSITNAPTVTNLTDSGLTSTYMMYAGTGGLLSNISTFTNSSGNLTLSTAGAASTSPLYLTGTLETAGTATTNYPYLYHNKGASNPSTWSTAGTVFGANEASGFTGNFLDVHTNGGSSLFNLNATGQIGVASAGAPTADILLPAGTATAGTAPLRFTSGTLLTSAVAGAMEFLTDQPYFTITTGTAREAMTLWSGTPTEFGVSSPIPAPIPFETTNGRLTDNTNLEWDNSNYDVVIAGGTQQSTITQGLVVNSSMSNGAANTFTVNGSSGAAITVAPSATAGNGVGLNGVTAPTSSVQIGGTCAAIGPVGTCWTSTGQLGYCSGAAGVCTSCTAC